MEEGGQVSEEATIRRGVRNARYTTLPNHVFEDIRLSMEARWLLGYLLSKPDNWTVRMGDIAKKGVCGRDKARRMINELVELGYAEKDQQREDGRFSKLSLVIYDEPKEASEINGSGQGVAFVPQTENPSTVNPSTEKPATANAALLKTEDLAIPDSQIERERGREGEDHKTVVKAFKRAFMAWPTAISDSEPQAFDAWAALSLEEREAAATGAERYVAASKATGRKMVCSFAVYLREHRWEKLPEAVAPASKPVSREVRPFGPGWASLRFRALLGGPVELGDPDMTRAKREANYLASRQMLGAAKAEATYRSMGHEIGANGELLFPDDFEERMWRGHVITNGYPEVNRLDKAAREGRSLPAPDGWFDPAAQLMEAVPVGLRVWKEWQAEFERRQWPWLPSPGKQPVVFFPVGGPEGLAMFEQAIRDEGTGDDGGTREAAE